MHPKKRLEVIIERMAQGRACKVLEEAELTGYTVISAMAGYGDGKHWQRDTDLSTAQDMVVIISIGSPERIETAVRRLNALFAVHIGVLSVSTVDVMRPELF